eukprot:m.210064 g.210064  ORF g.210064 m.210064 type:complete len:919 (-) comp17814_c0_seq10:559-3315(-)
MQSNRNLSVGSEVSGGASNLAAGGSSARRPHKQEDFVQISEFCEIDGPKPVHILPGKIEGFDHDAFALRVLSVDYQHTAVSGLHISKDAQAVMSDPHGGFHAYVRFFTLFDIKARGYVRSFAVAYVTTTDNKVMDYFSSFQDDFDRVTAFLKYGNRLEFHKALEQRRADLVFSREALNDSIDATSTSAANIVTLAQLVDDVDAMIAIIAPLLEDPKLRRRFEPLVEPQKTRNRPKRATSLSASRKATSVNDIGLPAEDPPEPSRDRSLSLTSQEASRLIDPSKPRNFTEALKTLDLLCGKGYTLGMERLTKALHYYQRESMVLTVEQDESTLLHNPTLLLTIGHCVVLNFYKAPQKSIAAPVFDLPHAQPMSSTPLRPSAVKSRFAPPEKLSDSKPIEKGGLAIPGERPPALDRLSELNSARFDELDGISASPQSYSVYVDACNDSESESDSASADFVSMAESLDLHSVEASRQPTQSPSKARIQRTDSSGTLESLDMPASIILSMMPGQPYQKSTTRFPFHSSAAHVCHAGEHVAGAGILRATQTYPFLIHAVFALMHGRTVVIRGQPSSEHGVRSLVNTLRLFVPGFMKGHVIVPWREKTSLTLAELASVRLIGLSKEMPNLPANVDRMVAVLDFDNATLLAPTYSGTYLEGMLVGKSFASDKAFFAHIHSVFLELAHKAYLYFHCCCVPSDEAPYYARKMLPSRAEVNAQLGLQDCDTRIVMYLAEVILMQCEAETSRSGGAQHRGACFCKFLFLFLLHPFLFFFCSLHNRENRYAGEHEGICSYSATTSRERNPNQKKKTQRGKPFLCVYFWSLSDECACQATQGAYRYGADIRNKSSSKSVDRHISCSIVLEKSIVLCWKTIMLLSSCTNLLTTQTLLRFFAGGAPLIRLDHQRRTMHHARARRGTVVATPAK